MPGIPLELLRQVPLFSELDEAELSGVASLFKQRRFSDGETITKEGSGGAAFFVIESGQVAVSVNGRPRPPLSAGDHFGEVALIDGRERSASLTATGDLVCYGLTFWDFQPLVRENAAIAWGLLQYLASLLRAAQDA